MNYRISVTKTTTPSVKNIIFSRSEYRGILGLRTSTKVKQKAVGVGEMWRLRCIKARYFLFLAKTISSAFWTRDFIVEWTINSRARMIIIQRFRHESPQASDLRAKGRYGWKSFFQHIERTERKSEWVEGAVKIDVGDDFKFQSQLVVYFSERTREKEREKQ